ncbi:Putative sialic acid transporter [Aquisphaera giovannonii]|uniref:Sialic acid transporter n=1 Tax=Aquisphaera giovannonii TaxID=406548 RepID=A0A5B9W4I7_9BACT|nr:MFS transporter [Aquisphaera giovannonii]QEH35129.1 Putative sialic acid transporter [Aquisphaera giovannonii]
MTRTETTEPIPADAPWWGELTRSHRWILLAAMLGWLFDAMDQRIFVVARTPALRALLPGLEADLPSYAGWATGLFIAGWATGGLLFGLLGDRYGRVRTMTWTIILYSVFTALSGLARSWPEFAAYRFLCGMGIGGEYAAGVALVAEAMPARARAFALGAVQASSSIGAIIGSGLSLLVGPQGTAIGVAGWRILFFFGALPSLMVIPIRLRVPEPDRWLRARDRAREEAAEGAPARPELRLGDLRAIFRDPVLRRRTLVGMTLGMVGQIGLWSIGLFTPELVRGGMLTERRLATPAPAFADPPARDLDALARQRAGTPEEAAALATSWKREDDRLVGWGTMLQDVGSFLGAPLCTFVAVRFGRRKSFALAYAMAMASVWLVFGTLSKGADVYWMLPLLGFCTCGIFGVIIVYLPELYPTRLRTTGTGFCYNIARYITATGPLVLGKLTLLFTGLGYATPIRPAALCLSFIYVLGLLLVPFAPETRGQPLPE